MSRADAERAGSTNLLLFYSGAAAAIQADEPTEELAQADISMTSYLERYGGFKDNKESGLVMWILAHAMDAAAQEDFHATKEYLALLIASTECAGWELVSGLRPEPHGRTATAAVRRQNARCICDGQTFCAPLVPPQWLLSRSAT